MLQNDAELRCVEDKQTDLLSVTNTGVFHTYIYCKVGCDQVTRAIAHSAIRIGNKFRIKHTK